MEKPDNAVASFHNHPNGDITPSIEDGWALDGLGLEKGYTTVFTRKFPREYGPEPSPF